jgi:hypothetical protein
VLVYSKGSSGISLGCESKIDFDWDNRFDIYWVTREKELMRVSDWR